MSGSGKGRVYKPYLFRCLPNEPSSCTALLLLVFPSSDRRAMSRHSASSIFGISSVFEKVLSSPCWLPAQSIEAGFEFLTILPQLPSAEIAGSPGHPTSLPVLIGTVLEASSHAKFRIHGFCFAEEPLNYKLALLEMTVVTHISIASSFPYFPPSPLFSSLLLPFLPSPFLFSFSSSQVT